MTARTNQLRAEARALKAAAKILIHEAETMARAAESNEALADHQETMDQISEAIENVRASIDRGADLEQTIARVAEAHQLRPDTLAAYWRDYIANDFQMKLWRRNREVMRLAWTGKTNAQIGRLVGLRHSSVSRIIRAKLREGWAEKRLPPKIEPLGSPYTRGTAPGRISIAPPRETPRQLSLASRFEGEKG